MELDEYHQNLLEKIKQIDDPEILNLLADGAHQRALRYDATLTPASKAEAERFANEVEKLAHATGVMDGYKVCSLRNA